MRITFGVGISSPDFAQRRLVLLADDVHAQLDALVANEDGRPGNELAHLVLAFAAERAVERVLRIAAANLAHSEPPSKTLACSSILNVCRFVQSRIQDILEAVEGGFISHAHRTQSA